MVLLSAGVAYSARASSMLLALLIGTSLLRRDGAAASVVSSSARAGAHASAVTATTAQIDCWKNERIGYPPWWVFILHLILGCIPTKVAIQGGVATKYLR